MSKRDKAAERHQRKQDETQFKAKVEKVALNMKSEFDPQEELRKLAEMSNNSMDDLVYGQRTVTGRISASMDERLFSRYSHQNDAMSYILEMIDRYPEASTADFMKMMYGGGQLTEEDEAKIESRRAALNMNELIGRYGPERTLKALIAVLEEMGDLDNIFEILRGEMRMQESRHNQPMSPRYGRREDFNEF